MADTHDTIDGLLAEFRGYSAGMPASYHVTMSWADFRKMLARFDAAHKRELAVYVLAIAKLRGALVKCRDIALLWQADEAAGVAGTTDKPHARSAAEAMIDIEFEINAALFATATAEKLSAVGDAAKLREAIMEIRRAMMKDSGAGPATELHATIDAITQAALAAPATTAPMRNCDRFKTAAEAIDAYQDLTGDQLATDSGMKEWVEFAVWLFAPATEKEGGAK